MTKEKILVIDDIAENVYMIKEMLERENFRVITALDGTDGIEKALAENPKLIICDIMMPDVNGFNVIETLRKNPKTISTPFIFLSARAAVSDLRQGLLSGADDYLTKPVKKKELIETVNLRLSKKAQYEKKLEELRQSVSFALPHELKTPLVSILGFSQIMKNDADKLSATEISDMSDMVYQSAQNLNNIIQKMLFFVKLGLLTGDESQMQIFRSGYTHVTFQTADKIIIPVAEQFKRQADLSIDLPETNLAISEDNFNIVLKELVENAFKFSSQSNKVKVSGSAVGENYSIYVINEGHGMTEEQVASLGGFLQFDRMFYEQAGVGLGLAIAKKIVDIHSGTFSVDSIPNKKTMIGFTLPLFKPA